MDEYFYPVDVLDKTNPKGGSWVALWQHVKDGVQVGFCEDGGAPVDLPKIHEVRVTSTDQHFAPGVLKDPAAPETSIPMADLMAAIRDGTSAELVARFAPKV